MKNFVRSQVDQVDADQYVTTDPKTKNRSVKSYDAKEPNRPINMELVRTFYPIRSKDGYYSIVFEVGMGEQVNHMLWYYSPTNGGKSQRDADIAVLYSTFTAKCPVDSPSIRR